MKKELKNKKRRVVVGLSGGVDSSVTAALLQRQGYEVIGVYMKNWDTESPTLGNNPLEADSYRLTCPWYDDYLDAKRVALKLGIPFHVCDFREAYKTKVFDVFLAEFTKGRTPNADIYCNSLLKFDEFINFSLTFLKADYVATGHYARISKVRSAGSLSQSKAVEYLLQIPKDNKKDQTYFLYRLSQEQLAHTLFPLAEYTKDEVRELAKQFDLPTKYKKDSQGMCFVGDVSMREFMAHWLPEKLGDIHDLEGRVIGKHQGVHFTTIGGKIAVDNALVAKHYPQYKHDIPHFYVVRKYIDDNIVMAVPGHDHPTLFERAVVVDSIIDNYVSRRKNDQQVFARLRHGGNLVPLESITSLDDDRRQLAFTDPQRALTPGQHIVLYSNEDLVLGGGVISE